MQIELQQGKRITLENDIGQQISLCAMIGDSGEVMLNIDAPNYREVRERSAPRLPARASRPVPTAERIKAGAYPR